MNKSVVGNIPISNIPAKYRGNMWPSTTPNPTPSTLAPETGGSGHKGGEVCRRGGSGVCTVPTPVTGFDTGITSTGKEIVAGKWRSGLLYRNQSRSSFLWCHRYPYGSGGLNLKTKRYLPRSSEFSFRLKSPPRPSLVSLGPWRLRSFRCCTSILLSCTVFLCTRSTFLEGFLFNLY